MELRHPSAGATRVATFLCGVAGPQWLRYYGYYYCCYYRSHYYYHYY